LINISKELKVPEHIIYISEILVDCSEVSQDNSSKGASQGKLIGDKEVV
jgi:hypothetical protein